MLTFLFVAASAGIPIERYEDEAVGTMTRNEQGVPWVSTVVLTPRITYGGAVPPAETQVDLLHHAAHEQCFIANSVRTAIVVQKPQG